MARILTLGEASGISENDYVLVDSPTQGSRRYKAKNFIGGDPVVIEKTITQNGIYNAADDNADGFSDVIVNVEGGEITPVFSGLSYGYLTTDGKFYSSESANNKMDVFEVESNTLNTIALLANPNKNRGRVCFFANKNYSDFSEYILNPHVSEEIYTYTKIILSADNVTTLKNANFLDSRAGILIAVTNSTGNTSTKAILGSLNVNQ